MPLSAQVISVVALCALSTATAASAQVITLTPWCDNSFRVQVVPSSASTAYNSASASLQAILAAHGLEELPGALIDECGPGASFLPSSEVANNGNLGVVMVDGSLRFSNVATGDVYTTVTTSLSASSLAPYLAVSVDAVAGDAQERLFGLGQGGWTGEANVGCPVGNQTVVPLQRNGQTVFLQQRKFHVSIPWVYSTAGYGMLYNMPGYGNATMGAFGVGGMHWSSDAALAVDFWVSGVPAGDATNDPRGIYRQYADATGHAPPLREDAMIFWQSRNRYKSSAIAEAIAGRYAALELPVGVLVVDYENQRVDGDFLPNPACYPSVQSLAANVRSVLNATTVFSFWPEVKNTSSQFPFFTAAGCLSNSDLGGFVIDTTIPNCRSLIWTKLLKPNYADSGVTAYWLDETDGAGTNGGYRTSFGPAIAFSQLWVNSWISAFSRPIAQLGEEAPLVLTRGVWAGGQRYGVVLWSSDILSTFGQLASMVPQGVHASLSGIPWWATDVGGYGCNSFYPNDSPYMQELIVRWYQFGLWSPIFRTHGCRQGPSEPDVAPCVKVPSSCGGNEVWSYGNATQTLLSALIRYRAEVLKPYIAALAHNVTVEGAPTVRPLWWGFPDDPACYNLDDQFLFGPDYLVAPVTTQGATNRSVVFPAGAKWQSVWDASIVVEGGVTQVVQAPLNIIPVYLRL